MSAGLIPARTIDAKGLKCPLPIIKAKKGIDQISSGEILEVLSDDPGAKEDFPRWSKRTGHELIQVVHERDFSRYYIRRK
ncbi:MAG: sulfurtransferase TusA family protein [Candidatus Hodarchaeota archaeon]